MFLPIYACDVKHCRKQGLATKCSICNKHIVAKPAGN